MTIIYRTTGAWGAGQGFNLTPAQLDGNFYDLATRVNTIETTPPAAVGISSITVVGDQMTINLTNSTAQGPFTLPTPTLTPKGTWQPGTIYSINDLVNYGGTTYLVTWDHTSAATFDPGANDGAGHNFYSALIESPSSVIPAGGAQGTILRKVTATDYDMGWGLGAVPSGGLSNQILAKLTNVAFDMAWVNPNSLVSKGLAIKSVTAGAYTLLATTISNPTGDEFTYIRASCDSIVVPTNAAQPFAIGSEVTVRSMVIPSGTPTMVITAASGVTLNIPSGFQQAFFGVGAVITFKKILTDTWEAFGLFLPT